MTIVLHLQVLASVVISHVPSFKDTLKIPPASATASADPAVIADRRLGYARRLCAALRDLDLPWVPSPESIVAARRRNLLLLTLELFWSLPKCEPEINTYWIFLCHAYALTIGLNQSVGDT